MGPRVCGVSISGGSSATARHFGRHFFFPAAQMSTSPGEPSAINVARVSIEPVGMGGTKVLPPPPPPPH